MARFCASCGAQMSEHASFCKACGAAAGISPQKTVAVQENKDYDEKESGASTINLASGIKSVTSAFKALPAAAVPGEVSLGSNFSIPKITVPGLNQIPLMNSGQIMGPFKYLSGGFTRTIRGMKTVFKNKKRLIPVIILAAVWLVLNLLPAFGIEPDSVKILSILTFAKGGTTGGALDIAGGLFGKSIFAFFITSMVMPIFTRRKPSAAANISGPSKGGVSQFFGSLSESLKNTASLPLLLLGCAIAFLIYNFMTGDNSLQKSMAGISALLLSIRAIANKTGFLRGFLTAWMNKSKSKKEARAMKKNAAGTAVTPINSDDAVRAAKRFIAGLSLGFALSIPLSAIGYPYTAYIAGAVLILASAVLALASKGKKEVGV